MKYLLLLIPFILNAWTFTEKDFNKLTESQKSNLDIIYMVGETKGLGLRLAAKAIVETRLGKVMGKKNHICGVMQIDINYTDATCDMLDSNTYLSAKIALEQLIGWTEAKVRTTEGKWVYMERSVDKATVMYNVGKTGDPYGFTHLYRVHMVEAVLIKHYKG